MERNTHDCSEPEILCEELAEVASRGNPSVHDILEASPYDDRRNFDSTLTEDLFRRLMFVESNSIQTKFNELGDLLTSTEHRRQVVFLSGFPGGGKTTFLKHFLQAQNTFRSVYIDVGKRPRPEPSTHHPLCFRLINFIQGYADVNSQNRSQVFDKFLELCEQYENVLRQNLWDELIDPFLAKLDSFKDRSKRSSELNKLLNAIEPQHIYLFFFLLMFSEIAYNREHQPASEADPFQDQYAICFDNLDALSIEHLGEEFGDKLQPVLLFLPQIAGLKSLWNGTIAFKRGFRILFAVRQGNYNYLQESLSHYEYFKRWCTHVEFGFLTGDLYKQLVSKRIIFAETLHSCFDHYSSAEESETALAQVKLAADATTNFIDQIFFENCLVRLFNGDIKNLNAVLMAAAVDESGSALLKTAATIPQPRRSIESYGIAGALLHWALFSLTEDNFLRSYIFDHPPTNEWATKGYASHNRLLLTVILNRTNFKPDGSNRRIDNLKPFITLLELMNEFRFKEIFEYELTLESLAQAFLFHKRGWSHLVAIHGTEISDQAALLSGYQPDLERYSALRERHNTEEERREIGARLDNVRFAITPAGFALVRYVLPHFEYYSHLVGRKGKPLFCMNVSNAKHSVDEYIGTVHKQVERHAESIRDFFKNVLAPFFRENGSLRRHNDVNELYKTSAFTFKFRGARNDYFNVGWPHIARVITSHIDYVDRFRRYLLAKTEANSTESKREVSGFVLPWIERYVELLGRRCTDRWITNRLVSQFMQKVEQAKRQPDTMISFKDSSQV